MIPNEKLLRLISAMLGDTFDMKDFKYQIENGFSLTPDFEDSDLATLARIAAGESWDRK